MKTLSGGNQQKVCVSRWLVDDVRLLILEEPTRGVDVGARREIYRALRQLANRGLAVLVLSSDVEEIAGLSDRSAVIDRGRIVARLERGAAPGAVHGRGVGRAFPSAPPSGERMTAAVPDDRPSTPAKPLRIWSGVAILLAFYVALIAVFAVLSPFFFSIRNMMAIGSNVAFIGLMAAAGTPLIIAGGLDLSVAAVAGLSGVVIALLFTAGLPIWGAVAVTVAIGAFIGLVNGLFATRLRAQPADRDARRRWASSRAPR